MPYYGIDWDGPLPDAEEAGSVEVPRIPNPLGREDMEELEYTICPTAFSEDYGIDVYSRTLQYTLNKLRV